MSRPLLVVVTVLAATTMTLAGCGGASSGTGAAASTTGSSPAAAVSGTITVFAAASLTGSFTDLGKSFEAANPGTTIRFSFGPSSGLAEQIDQGAPADVFASAATQNMDQVVSAGNASDPVTFADNEMEIAVPPDNPAGISSLADLAKAGTKVVLCAADVPCGVTARAVLDKSDTALTPVSNEVDVKSTLAKVTLGEADAGIVYVTDVKAAGSKVKGIQIPDDVNATTAYPIAPLTAGKNPALAQAFVAYVLGSAGRAELASAGFAKP